ncbi:hypothetical protein CLOLEP_01285 [[Clostridium] leptum DSM 753]|uniref:Uncharacterized protein n=1 Tax=[Clostridium] leptum DSM 753 TaxID=428125 RepID=A7VRV1_9FIRM|nr:hypothetical protein CLOLEP_01285 [[Clostridium] leptum DSM 753]
MSEIYYNIYRTGLSRLFSQSLNLTTRKIVVLGILRSCGKNHDVIQYNQ